MTNVPAGWYPNPYDTTVELYWDGDDWTDSSRPAQGVVAEEEPAAPAPPATPDAPAAPVARPRRLVPVLLGGGELLVVAAVVGVTVLALQPHYPDTAPLDRAGLDSLVEDVAGVPLEQHMNDAAVFDGTRPSGCGIVAQLGSGLRQSSDATSGLAFYQVWGYAAGEDAPWINARLFPSPEAARGFIAQMQDALTLCPKFTRPGAAQPLTATDVSDDDGVLRFDYPSPGTHVVLTSRDNAVFVLLFDQVPEDPSYLAAVRG